MKHLFKNINRVEKDIKPLSEHRKMKNSLKAVKYSSLFVLGSAFAYLAVEFYATHNFRSPIVFQDPFPRKTIISPVSTQSAMLIHKAYAFEESKIKPEDVNMFNRDEVKSYVKQEAIRTFGREEWIALEELLTRESGFNAYAYNTSSGALGLFQALPGNKYGAKGLDIKNQVAWGFQYIIDRYDLPSKALKFHDQNNWY